MHACIACWFSLMFIMHVINVYNTVNNDLASLLMRVVAEFPPVLSWATRLNIAVGAAKGLAFLHDAEKPVIYRDFKTSNILLDPVRT